MNLRNNDCNNSPSRQARLRAWMALHCVTNVQLARQIEVNETTISNIIHGRRVARKHVEALIAVGVPENLLPDIPEPQKPGPKPKMHEVCDHESEARAACA